MNYKKHYKTLTDRSPKLYWDKIKTYFPQWKNIDGCYREGHHIIPKCLGGKCTPENIVYLTPEEHYIAHQLLIKIYPNNNKLIYAARMMTVTNKDQNRRGNKLYGWLRRKVSKSMQSISGELHPLFGKKRPEHSIFMKKSGIIPPYAGGKSWKQMIVVCPHCKTKGGKSNMIRYHFNNCKKLNNAR